MDRIKKAEIDIKREISFIINTKVNDPRIGFVTVTGAELSVDFKWLDVFISIMGDEDEIKRSFEGLNSCKGFIKRNLQQRLKLRSVPSIKFLYDKSIDTGIRVSKILDDLEKDKRQQAG
ncbi:MAG: 30S ribosome-binding factor RbfA [Candidatus Humimicrobiaceae bacterium]|nr:30S ribosome-binding factor RbfA [Actinomycetota bacterium]MDD5600584.1 30S ribosome-binding factor RbfA [Actinomycetota bacterium]MDY0027502.1 30S ribosome-binding factor RbfA [Candidatus Humimicrobiaceae bacterium]